MGWRYIQGDPLLLRPFHNQLVAQLRCERPKLGWYSVVHVLILRDHMNWHVNIPVGIDPTVSISWSACSCSTVSEPFRGIRRSPQYCTLIGIWTGLRKNLGVSTGQKRENHLLSSKSESSLAQIIEMRENRDRNLSAIGKRRPG